MLIGFFSHIFLHIGGIRTQLSPIDRNRQGLVGGFTMVELLIVIAIVATLVCIAVPVLSSHIDNARNARAMVEIRCLEKDIAAYAEKGEYPDSLSDVGRNPPDPWGNAYVYLKIAGGDAPIGAMRKDRFLVPVNSDYDLYSMGKDEKTGGPFNSPAGGDDIVRANDGGYVGLASDF
jgi:general secretion pathway protein G